MESMLLDIAGHRRSRATMPGYHRGRPPRNKGEQYPADPPTVEEIVAVMRTVGDRADGHRLRVLIVLFWRSGLRISEALALQESDLDRSAAGSALLWGAGSLSLLMEISAGSWWVLDGSAPPVGGDGRAGDVAGSRGGEERDDLGDLLGLRGAVHWGRLSERRDELGA